MAAFVDSAFLSQTVTTLIIINTLIMAMEFHDMPSGFRNTLELTNLVLTICFTIEMVLKLIALGPVKYWTNAFNFLDGFVVIVSILELLLQTGNSGGGFGALRALRLMRIMRSMKLI